MAQNTSYETTIQNAIVAAVVAGETTTDGVRSAVTHALGYGHASTFNLQFRAALRAGRIIARSGRWAVLAG